MAYRTLQTSPCILLFSNWATLSFILIQPRFPTLDSLLPQGPFSDASSPACKSHSLYQCPLITPPCRPLLKHLPAFALLLCLILKGTLDPAAPSPPPALLFIIQLHH